MKKICPSALILSVVFAALLFGSLSCKQPDLPKAMVTVTMVDADGEETPATDAMVRVRSAYYEQQMSFVYKEDGTRVPEWIVEVTDGTAQFTFKYEAIYEVVAWVKTSSTDSITATGILICKYDEVEEEVLELEE
ncbi:MAG: hypothetical protein KJ607_08405 [Bacteroidetes bacterium]|nr:hypothetical protein [Bacteroidota bacterium]